MLIGYAVQTRLPDEVVIADDGSGPETFETIERIAPALPFPLEHVWHEDDGFRKTRILNRAIVAASGDYLVFSDGDCVPRADFLAWHVRFAAPQRFLSGGYIKLSMAASKAMGDEEIRTGEAFSLAWLSRHGAGVNRRLLRLAYPGSVAALLDALTPTRASWNGHNASTWKDLLVETNGFDQRMAYGGEDRELGERLMRMGVVGHQIRHRAICVHLDHGRGYVRPEHVRYNRDLRRHNARQERVRTPAGIDAEGHEDGVLPITLVVLTRDEARNIGRCLASVPFAAEKLVIDSGSVDGTREIARGAGARVIEQDWLGYGPQRNFAATQATHPWILVLDADEWLGDDLRRELTISLPGLLASDAAGMVLRRTAYFMGKPLAHYKPMVLERKARIYHRDRGTWTCPAVHEKLELSGRFLEARAPLFHEFCRNSAEHQIKLANYARLKAEEQFRRGRTVSSLTLPLVYPVEFVKKYLLQRAMFDGARGFILAHNEAQYSTLKRNVLKERELRLSVGEARSAPAGSGSVTDESEGDDNIEAARVPAAPTGRE